MRCAGFSYTPVLVELHQVGIVGLRKALSEIDESGLTDQEALLDLLMAKLSNENYVPPEKTEAYRTTLWREYLRFIGEDFSDYYSQVNVTVHGDPGEELDQFLVLLNSVFAHYELTPNITFAPKKDDETNPQLDIDGNIIVRGIMSRKSFKTAVRKSFSQW